MMEDDEPIEFEPGIRLVKAADYIPYSSWRVKRILKEYFGCHMETIGGYKYNRTHSVNHYRVVVTETGEVLLEDVTLYQLQKWLAKKGFPRYDDKCTYCFPVYTKK